MDNIKSEGDLFNRHSSTPSNKELTELFDSASRKSWTTRSGYSFCSISVTLETFSSTTRLNLRSAMFSLPVQTVYAVRFQSELELQCRADQGSVPLQDILVAVEIPLIDSGSSFPRNLQQRTMMTTDTHIHFSMQSLITKSHLRGENGLLEKHRPL